MKRDGRTVRLLYASQSSFGGIKNGHSSCHATTRCKKYPHYEPSRQFITNPKAEKMLECAINNSAVFKSPDDFVLARDTSYVESFNNVMNIFQDKRISFTDQ